MFALRSTKFLKWRNFLRSHHDVTPYMIAARVSTNTITHTNITIFRVVKSPVCVDSSLVSYSLLLYSLLSYVLLLSSIVTMGRRRSTLVPGQCCNASKKYSLQNLRLYCYILLYYSLSDVASVACAVFRATRHGYLLAGKHVEKTSVLNKSVIVFNTVLWDWYSAFTVLIVSY